MKFPALNDDFNSVRFDRLG